MTEFGMPILMPPASCHVLVPCLVQGRFDGRPIVYFWIDIGVKVVYQTPLRRYYQKNPMTLLIVGTHNEVLVFDGQISSP